MHGELGWHWTGDVVGCVCQWSMLGAPELTLLPDSRTCSLQACMHGMHRLNCRLIEQYACAYITLSTPLLWLMIGKCIDYWNFSENCS